MTGITSRFRRDFCRDLLGNCSASTVPHELSNLPALRTLPEIPTKLKVPLPAPLNKPLYLVILSYGSFSHHHSLLADTWAISLVSYNLNALESKGTKIQMTSPRSQRESISPLERNLGKPCYYYTLGPQFSQYLH